MKHTFLICLLSIIICLQGISQTVTITPSNANICYGDMIAFTYSYSGLTDPVSCLWDFGDGSTSTVCNPTFLYTTGGLSYDACLTLTDANNVEIEECVTVIVQDEISFSLQATDPTCVGSTDGSIICFPDNTSANYIYTWSNGANTNQITGLPTGTYFVTITDITNGCTADGFIDIIEPVDITASFQSTQPTSCSSNDGEIIGIANGGTPPYTYDWGNGNTTAVVQGLDVGYYNVTITDSNGCTAEELEILTAQSTCTIPTDTIYWFEETSIGSNFYITQNPTIGGYVFFSLEDGGFTDTSPYGNYTIDIVAGVLTYTVSAFGQDTLGILTYNDLNQESLTIYIIQISSINDPCILNPLDLTSIVITESTCGQSNGSISDIIMENGTPPYTYEWSNGSTAPSIPNLFAGTYTFTITDANNCIYGSDPLVVSNIDGPIVNIDQITPATCNSVDGAAVLLPANYSYVWNNGLTGSNATGLAAGDYIVTVVDPSSPTCPEVLNITIPENNSLNLSISFTNPSCGESDGSITVTPSGGSGSYSYLWSTGDTSPGVITGLLEGSYSVIVTDDNTNCSIEEIIILVDEAPTYSTTITINNISEITCPGGSDGFVDFIFTPAIGMTEIIDPNTDAIVMNGSLSEGFYCINAYDSNGCLTGQECFDLTGPPPIDVITDIFHPECGNAPNFGNIITSVAGGNPPYTYEWSNGEVTQDLLNLDEGVYSLTITDENACTIVIDNLVLTAFNPMGVITFNNLPTGTTCAGENDGFIDFTVSPTTGITTEIQDLNGTVYTNGSLPGGEYYVIATDGDGCSFQEYFEILQPFPLNVTGIYDGFICPGETATLLINEVFDTYTWSSGETTQSIQATAGGIYSCTVTDATGCTAAYTFPEIIESNDCVWPGDANYDGVADNMDILALGIAYGNTGQARSSTNTNWEGQLAAFEWDSIFTNGINHKHADCDGNGIVEQNDTLAIVQNYGLAPHVLRETSANGEHPLTINFDATNSNYGELVELEINIGDLTEPIPEAYGLAFTIQFNYPEVINPSTVNVDFNSSVFGDNNQTISLYKGLLDQGKMDFAITRFDHTSVNNVAGEVVRLSFIIEDNIDGFNSTDYVLEAEITNVMCIKTWGEEIPLIPGESEMTMFGPDSNDNLPTVDEGVDAYPNPTDDIINLSLKDGASIQKVRVFNTIGELITEKYEHNIQSIRTQEWAEGIYFFEITDQDENAYLIKVCKK